MKKRLISALGMIAILILMFVSKIWTPYVFDVGIGVIMILAGYEMSNMLLKMGLYNFSVLAGLFPIVLYSVCLALILTKVNIIIVFASMVICTVGVTILTFVVSLIFKKWLATDLRIRGLQTPYPSFAIRKSIYSMITFFYPAILLMFLVLTNHLGDMGYFLTGIDKFGGVDVSFIALVVAFLVPIISDTFAMLFGMLLKGPKLCPKTSPNKTISGFVSGVIMTTLVMVALFFVLTSFGDIKTAFDACEIGLVHFAMIGFFGSLVSTAGDLFESFLKRRAMVKDSSNFIPGHGGVLDRLDSHTFNAPFVFFFFFVLLI